LSGRDPKLFNHVIIEHYSTHLCTIVIIFMRFYLDDLWLDFWLCFSSFIIESFNRVHASYKLELGIFSAILGGHSLAFEWHFREPLGTTPHGWSP